MARLASCDLSQLVFSSLAAPQAFANRLLELLSADELQRASRFRFETHRSAFIVARGLLRVMLGRYLEMEPAAIQFCYGPNGKPGVAHASDLRFNVSHSGQMVLYAFRRNRDLGVDLEQIRLVNDMEAIARRFFSAAEYADLMTIPSELRARAFFDCWTRKEAFVKALGDGLTYPLDRFQVTLRPGQPAAFIRMDRHAGSGTGWSLYDVAPSAAYAAAVAFEGPDSDFQVRKFETPEECADFYR